MTRMRIIFATGCLILGVLIAWSWATHDRFRSTADRLLLLQPLQQKIRRRTARAAFRREQLHENENDRDRHYL